MEGAQFENKGKGSAGKAPASHAPNAMHAHAGAPLLGKGKHSHGGPTYNYNQQTLRMSKPVNPGGSAFVPPAASSYPAASSSNTKGGGAAASAGNSGGGGLIFRGTYSKAAAPPPVSGRSAGQGYELRAPEAGGSGRRPPLLPFPAGTGTSRPAPVHQSAPSFGRGGEYGSYAYGYEHGGKGKMSNAATDAACASSAASDRRGLAQPTDSTSRATNMGNKMNTHNTNMKGASSYGNACSYGRGASSSASSKGPPRSGPFDRSRQDREWERRQREQKEEAARKRIEDERRRKEEAEQVAKKLKEEAEAARKLKEEAAERDRKAAEEKRAEELKKMKVVELQQLVGKLGGKYKAKDTKATLTAIVLELERAQAAAAAAASCTGAPSSSSCAVPAQSNAGLSCPAAASGGLPPGAHPPGDAKDEDGDQCPWFMQKKEPNACTAWDRLTCRLCKEATEKWEMRCPFNVGATKQDALDHIGYKNHMRAREWFNSLPAAECAALKTKLAGPLAW